MDVVNNIYEELSMHLRANAFNDEDVCYLTSAEVLLILAIIQDHENMYATVRNLKNVIINLENRLQMLTGDPIPEEDFPFPDDED